MRPPAKTGLIAIAGLILLTVPTALTGSEECLACHSDPSLTMERDGRTVALLVDPDRFAGSVHADSGCAACHQDLDGEQVPHGSPGAVVCAECHTEAAEQHPFHPQMDSPGDPGTACSGCHGVHDVLPPDSPGSKLTGAALLETCGECHEEVVGHFRDSAHGEAFLSRQEHAPTCVDCHDRPLTLRRAGEKDRAGLKLAQEKTCLACHLDDEAVRERMTPDAGFIAAYERSVHGAALLAGSADAANCVDCHGSHEMRRGLDPASRVSKPHLPETCGRCHAGIAEEYARSSHASALRRGSRDAPVCTDCHGEHGILGPSDPRSPVAAANVPAQVCSPCHSSVRLSEKYGISSDRFRSFADSYHGLAIRGGGVVAANCVSCHGAHDIRPSTDPASPVHKANLARTCGQCHPGANERFAVGAVHVVVEKARAPVLYWIARIYIGLIVIVVGGMIVHNALDFFRKAGSRFTIRKSGTPGTVRSPPRYLRMTVNERFQHVLLLASFGVLVITGFMLRYPEAWWVVGIRSLSENAFELRGLAHRIAAVVMVAASLYHLGYVALSARGRQFLRDILPSHRDFSDLVGVVAYNLGLSSRKPRFGRFGYVEKSEYWAVVWGTAIMVLTGAVMWFENTFIGLFTKLGWDIASTIHFYEAWLATLAIIVWHFYFVIFNPDVYPMNMVWITGKLSEEEMEEEHPLELEAIRTQQRAARPVRAERRTGGAGTSNA